MQIAISTSKKRKVDLALQGGGAHGAFTWGVLDRLLADERIEIEAISGTSAGALNAVVVADGLMENGREGARTALEEFWKAVSVAALPSPLKRTLFDVMVGVSLAIGHLLGGPIRAQSSSLSIASIARNVGLALFMAGLSDYGPYLIPTILTYMILGSFLAVPYAVWSKRRISQTA